MDGKMTIFRLLRGIVHVRRNPSAILLVVQLAGMLLVTFLDRTEVGRFAFAAIGIAILFLTVRLVRVTPWLTWVSVAFALPAIALQIVTATSDRTDLLPWSAALEAIFYSAA